jgi:hypothetical protein
MDYPYGADNTGIHPPHLDPWCKNYLKFIDLSSNECSSASANFTFLPIETSQNSGFVKMPITTGSQEYFIAELRQYNSSAMLYDASLPGNGILVWHIDDSIALDSARQSLNDLNTSAPHNAISIVTSDGKKSFPPGKANDPFSTGTAFTTPFSNSFAGTVSGISLSNISIVDGTALAAVATYASSTDMSINKTINYPNPAGKGYLHPKAASGILTTITATLSKAPSSLGLEIYDLIGNKVKTFPTSQITLNGKPSGDYKWVYECDWNGNNDNGENVAPGLYLYRFKADNSTRTGKLVIVR